MIGRGKLGLDLRDGEQWRCHGETVEALILLKYYGKGEVVQLVKLANRWFLVQQNILGQLEQKVSKLSPSTMSLCYQHSTRNYPLYFAHSTSFATHSYK